MNKLVKKRLILGLFIVLLVGVMLLSGCSRAKEGYTRAGSGIKSWFNDFKPSPGREGFISGVFKSNGGAGTLLFVTLTLGVMFWLGFWSAISNKNPEELLKMLYAALIFGAISWLVYGKIDAVIFNPLLWVIVGVAVLFGLGGSVGRNKFREHRSRKLTHDERIDMDRPQEHLADMNERLVAMIVALDKKIESMRLVEVKDEHESEKAKNIEGANDEIVAEGATAVAKETAEIEADIAAENEHETALAAEMEKIGDTIYKMHAREINVEQREETILNSLANFSVQLKSIPADKLNTLGKDYLAKYLDYMLKIFLELVSTEEYSTSFQEKAKKILDATESHIKKSLEKTTILEQATYRHQRKLKSLQHGQYNKLKTKINSDIKKARDTRKTLISGRKKAKQRKNTELVARYDAQISSIDKKISALKDRMDPPTKIRNQLKILQRKLRHLIGQVLSKIHEMKSLEDKIVDKTDDFGKHIKELEAADRQIKEADNEFKRAQIEIRNAELPEDMAVVMTDKAGTIFMELISVQDKSIVFNEKTMVPFIEESKETLKLEWNLVQAQKYLATGIRRLEQGFQMLNNMCIAIMQDEKADKHLVELNKILDELEGIEKFDAWKTRQEGQYIGSVYTKLQKVQSDLNRFVESLKKEKEHLTEVEKSALDTLTIIVERLVSRKLEENKDYQTAANQAMRRLSQARRLERKADSVASATVAQAA